MPPSWTKDNKSNTSPTWKRYLRRGTTQQMGDLSNFLFTDPIEEDGAPLVKDATIASFDSSSVTWTKDNKSTSPTWTKDLQS